MTDNLRFPAEWEACNAVLLAWPHAGTDWEYMLDEVRECFLNIVAAVSHHGNAIIVAPSRDEVTDAMSEHSGIAMDHVKVVEIETNDTWARDFGPITLLDNEHKAHLLDFKFNGWGLKFASDKDNLITSRLYRQHELSGEYINRLCFVLEGGSIETDGKGLILTTSECLLSPNRNGQMSREEIDNYLKKELIAEKILWLDHGFLEGDDTDSHIDTLARLAPDNTILYVKCDNRADVHFKELDAMEKQLKTFTTINGEPFNLIGLPMPDPIVEDGERLPATYANFLILNDAVLLPVYGQHANDFLAEQMIKIAFPDHKVIPIDCRALIKQHGSLHCMTMQIPGQ